MKYLISVILFLSLSLFLSSCSDNERGFGYATEASMTAPEPYKDNMDMEERSMEESGQSGGAMKIPERKIMRKVDMRFKVKDLMVSTTYIEQLTKTHQGYIMGMNQSRSGGSMDNELRISIPAEKLDEFIKALKSQSLHTDYTRIKAQDVTEEFMDITTRLKTKKEVRDRYIEILRNRAQNVEDILSAEEKIRVIQEEIESIEGRLKFLNNRTAFSQVSVEIYQEIPYVHRPDGYQKTFFSKVKDGFVNGWELIQAIVLGLITIWPIVLMVTLLLIYRKRIFGRFGRGTGKGGTGHP